MAAAADTASAPAGEYVERWDFIGIHGLKPRFAAMRSNRGRSIPARFANGCATPAMPTARAEIAALALGLARFESALPTGQAHVIDGG
ncbi:hypothetical protein GCM10008023_09440 [Sphingomonas glacialis]|uniref:Uncharacterized protein n=1 Tax=Sphingomonas glacialis TaxID=658225 RepID=A0ABQ3LCB4_9SPHN|nr:hypothetical protein [Sphingomonas glacialis]GHH10979.1 hypothetical protein GCM10008023_09440 [Sphingomonas glacialis]